MKSPHSGVLAKCGLWGVLEISCRLLENASAFDGGRLGVEGERDRVEKIDSLASSRGSG